MYYWVIKDTDSEGKDKLDRVIAQAGTRWNMEKMGRAVSNRKLDSGQQQQQRPSSSPGIAGSKLPAQPPPWWSGSDSATQSNMTAARHLGVGPRKSGRRPSRKGAGRVGRNR